MDYNILNNVANGLIDIYNSCKEDTCFIAMTIVGVGAIGGTLLCKGLEYNGIKKANKSLKKNNKLERSFE
jgi:hypothetical protein